MRPDLADMMSTMSGVFLGFFPEVQASHSNLRRSEANFLLRVSGIGHLVVALFLQSFDWRYREPILAVLSTVASLIRALYGEAPFQNSLERCLQCVLQWRLSHYRSAEKKDGHAKYQWSQSK